MVTSARTTRQTFRLGILGASEGNGHPYSWSAIINGYDADIMGDCPFPSIPDYLGKQKYPDDFLQDARVTHIWCENRAEAEHIAVASRIDHVVDNAEDLIGEVDAILLARDDAENHFRFAAPFLRAGLPIYIDKPLAVTIEDAERLFALDPTGGRIFSCSALRYADELRVRTEELARIGNILMIDAWAPKYWETYAVHVIEPLIAQFPTLDGIAAHEVHKKDGKTQLTVTWHSGVVTRFTTHGARPSPIGFKLKGGLAECEKTFSDSFGAFKKALEHFIGVARDTEANIPRQQTRKIVELIAMAGLHKEFKK